MASLVPNSEERGGNNGKFMIERLLKSRTDNTLIQLFRYTFVGGVAFIVDFGLLFILTDFFGSYAKGNYTVASDTDLLVVYRGKEIKDAYATMKRTLVFPVLSPMRSRTASTKIWER